MMFKINFNSKNLLFFFKYFNVSSLLTADLAAFLCLSSSFIVPSGVEANRTRLNILEAVAPRPSP